MKILLLGKDGQVGWELQRSLAPLGELFAFGRQAVNFEDFDGLSAAIRRHKPDVIVNSAAYTAVDKAESEQESAQRINADAVRVLAEEANRLNAWLVQYSTDYVFDGEKQSPYGEDDSTRPLSVYGKTKLEGERLIREIHAKHLIFRTSWVFATRGSNFAKTMIKLAKDRTELNVIADQHGAPTSAELIADVTALTLYRTQHASSKEFAGTYHLAASGATTWHGYAKYVLELAQASRMELKASADTIFSIATDAYPLPARRPKNSLLDTKKLVDTFDLQLPDWRFHVRRLVAELIEQGT